MQRIEFKTLQHASSNPKLCATLEYLKEELCNYCYAHGAGVVVKHEEGHTTHAPFALLPTPMPRYVYTHLMKLSPLMNLLYDRVARDAAFLRKTLEPSSKVDPFVRNLLSVHKRLYVDAKPVQQIALSITRSDYMLHYDNATQNFHPKQVEMNMISTSFACLSSHIYNMHRFLLQRHVEKLSAEVPAASTTLSHHPQDGVERESKFAAPEGSASAAMGALPIREVELSLESLPPSNNAMHGLADALAEAVNVYYERFYRPSQTRESRKYHDLYVLMVVQANERNAFDQRHLEYELHRRNIPVMRRSLGELYEFARVDEATKQLYVGDRAIAVVYYRAAYTPNDFSGLENPETVPEWIAMERMEASLAIKCPTVAHHLAGTKKVQQELAQPGVTERYLSAEEASGIRTLYAGLWGLENDDPATQSIIKQAISNPDKFVLKPQREGGGNNLWGEDLVRTLQTSDVEGRSAFILMSKIEPKSYPQAYVRQGKLYASECLCELGVYGTMISESSFDHSGAPAGGERVIRNQTEGTLLRTKPVSSNEGGVNAGYAVLDTPILYEL